MIGEKYTRRGVLRSGAAIGAATLGGLAGCLSRFDGGGEEGDRSYEKWLPSHAALGSSGESYLFAHLDVAAVVEHRDRFDGGEYEVFADSFGGEHSFLPPIESVDALTVAFAGAAGATLLVAEGSFSREEAADAVIGAGHERTGEHGGFEMYSGSRGAFGVEDGVVAGVPSGLDDADELARTVIDAGRGEAERLVAADGEAARLVEEVGSGFNEVGLIAPRNLDEGYDPGAVTAVGRSVRLIDEGVELELVLLYDDPESVDADAVEATAGEDRETLGRARDVSASASGRVVTVSGTADADRLSFEGYIVNVGPDPNARPPTPPEASFEFDHDSDAGAVTITHGGGEAFTPENTGTLLYGTREAAADGALQEWELPVEAGDSVTLRGVESGDGVIVFWESNAGDRMPVGTFKIP